MSYAELLRDPRWQRKRLEIMDRAQFRCEECGMEDRTLNVHHVRYVAGRKPWEYEDSELRCLCEPCHKKVHGKTKPTKREPRRSPEELELMARMADIDRRLIGSVGTERDAIIEEKREVFAKLSVFSDRRWKS